MAAITGLPRAPITGLISMGITEVVIIPITGLLIMDTTARITMGPDITEAVTTEAVTMIRAIIPWTAPSLKESHSRFHSPLCRFQCQAIDNRSKVAGKPDVLRRSANRFVKK